MMSVEKTARGVSTLFFAWLVVGCEGPLESTDCAGLKTKDRCEDADLVEQSECAWVEVRRYEGACGDAEVNGQCVGFAGTEQGCGSYACTAPLTNPENLYLYYRERGDTVEMFDSPVCGPTPTHEWTACLNDPVEACDCACEP